MEVVVKEKGLFVLVRKFKEAFNIIKEFDRELIAIKKIKEKK